MLIPEEFIIQKFYQHAGYPKYVKSTNTYMGGCPVCREGKSWGRKRRCYYLPKETKICCHNCGWYGKPLAWIMEVEQITYNELVEQVDQCEFSYGIPEDTPKVEVKTSDLPEDCINMFDKSQLSYYCNEKMVRMGAELIVKRRLNTAVNRPKSLYVTLTDPVHKNRLIIPFYNHVKQPVFYQSRSILADDYRPKYLSKQNSEKTLFNYDNVESGADNIFITEGPIDSFFVRNSVAVAGIQERSVNTFTTTQKAQIDRLFLMQKVWLLDSQWSDQASLTKSEILLKSGACVFIWPKDIGTRFKDLNDMCIHFKINEITSDFLLENTYCGLKGVVKLKQIR